ncbi:MAG: GDSL-type esterase/lipase family protein [Bacteroidota bacterium]|nr:GDSL-type esterase/lipase family protein [Bacteroidota bacterium]MDP4196081.1 GDSL-type esterase/lipase family protein [Bacteroidota bacterium]
MYDKPILLIGDSITEGFDVGKLLQEFQVLNAGVSGDSTVETLVRINNELFEVGPEIAFLCIGTNDFARNRTDEYILKNISKIIEKIISYSPLIKVIPVSIFPTRNNLPRPNERINMFNDSLEALSIEKGLKYFNINRYFKDEKGQLRYEYTEDGLHLTIKAYELWAKLIKEFVLAS